MKKNSTDINKATKGLTSRFKLFFKRDYFQNHLVLWMLIFSFGANLADWILLAVFTHPVDSGIILHYNVYFGVDMIGDWKLAFIMPAVGLILLVVNILLGAYFYRNKERIASYVLLIAALMAQLSLLIASTSVIIINY